VVKMYRVLYEVILRGIPEELECLSKLNNILSLDGICIGSQTMFICSYRDIAIIKMSPHTSRQSPGAQPYREIVQPISIAISIESSNADGVIKAARIVYEAIKSCGLSIKLIAE